MSGIFFREDLVMKIFLWPFFLFQDCYSNFDIYTITDRVLNETFGKVKRSQLGKARVIPQLDRFIKVKTPRFLSFLETALRTNNSDKG